MISISFNKVLSNRVIFVPHENPLPTDVTLEKQIEHKITLLYLIERMDIPMSTSQIVQFALEEDLMHIFTVSQYLAEMVEMGYLEKSTEQNVSRYLITEDGAAALELFTAQLPPQVKTSVTRYISENLKSIKRNFEITANHFYEHSTNEYMVKCGIYDDGLMLMEVSLSVVSKKQAVDICNNWRNNTNTLYRHILDSMLSGSE